jgi:hypothetical protein
MVKKIFSVVLLAVSFSSCLKETPLEKLICHADVKCLCTQATPLACITKQTILENKKWTTISRMIPVECRGARGKPDHFQDLRRFYCVKFSLEPGAIYLAISLMA